MRKKKTIFYMSLFKKNNDEIYGCKMVFYSSERKTQQLILNFETITDFAD